MFHLACRSLSLGLLDRVPCGRVLFSCVGMTACAAESVSSLLHGIAFEHALAGIT